ncbi:hypothetical protein [Nocardiopsis sp. NPDC057823]
MHRSRGGGPSAGTRMPWDPLDPVPAPEPEPEADKPGIERKPA